VVSTAQRQLQVVGGDGTHYYTLPFSYPPGYTDIIPTRGDWLDILSLNNANYASCLYVALNNGNPFPVSYLPVRSPFYTIRVYNGCNSTVSGTFIIGRELFQPAKISVSLPSVMSVNIQSPLDNSNRLITGIYYPLDSSNNVNVDTQLKAGYANYMNVTILNAQAITANGNSSNIDVGGYPYVFVFIYVSAVSGTSPSLNVYLNAYDEVSGQSVSIASVTNITATGTYYLTATGLAVRYVNVSWTVGGTSPSFTTTITLKAKW